MADFSIRFADGTSSIWMKHFGEHAGAWLGLLERISMRLSLCDAREGVLLHEAFAQNALPQHRRVQLPVGHGVHRSVRVVPQDVVALRLPPGSIRLDFVVTFQFGFRCIFSNFP